MLLGVRRAEELRMSPGHLARVSGRMELPFTEMEKAVGGAGVQGKSGLLCVKFGGAY